MGIESDQLVYDYLSRVGDLAQQRQLPSGTRMRLVSRLRDEIDRGRAKAVADSPATIRRILARLGTPEEVVESAGDASAEVPEEPRAPRAAVPSQRGPRARRTPGEDDAPKGLRRMVPRPRRAAAPDPAPDVLPEEPRPSPPHLAGSDELGPSGSEPDWWRVDSSPFGLSDSVPGFVGGVEIPEILKPPPSPDDERGPRLRKGGPAVEDEEEDEEDGEDGDEEPVEAEETGHRRRWRIPRPRSGGDGEGPAFSNPLLLLAAALLTVGAALGNFLALGVGWLIAYASRKLSRNEAKMAALGLPALSVAAGIAWLWGRSEGRWGAPIKEGHMSDAMADTWPWVVRGAAVASALFLLWRSQRQRP
ncbi:hypothetical protein ACFWZ2_17710 [Streptomyces sp. NPDC059002]|uniref:hypothetical protein n=1 Tax=Streptomyces sp. NPDC059002 TaxID=3346690 RepID=UPI0036A0B33A